MPKTRNFSDREKPNAIDLLDIHNDINAVHLLAGIHHRSPRRRQNATLSEKSCSLSAKRTMSEKLITKKQLPDSPAPTPNAAIQRPANPIRPTAPASSPDSKKSPPKKTDCIYTVSIYLRNLELELGHFKGSQRGHFKGKSRHFG